MDFRKVAIQAAKEAGKIIRENFGQVKELRIKQGDWHEVLTEVDLEANRVILGILKENFPEHGIVSEESEPVGGKDYTWYVDPMDGTTNYTMGFPFIATCIGLVFRGKPVLGVVYNPIIDEMFVGEDGRGSSLNGEKIQVSKNSELKRTVVNYCHINSPEGIRSISKIFNDFKLNSRDFRRLGSGGLDFCWLACGRNDVYLRPDVVLHDVVAGYVVAREAGAKITDWQNRSWSLESEAILATNGTGIHEEVLEIINRSR